MNIQLGHMSYAELMQLNRQLSAQIETKRLEDLKVLADSYISQAQEAGYKPMEAIAALRPYAPNARRGSGRKPIHGVIRFRDPHNSLNVWSGKGRVPNWLRLYEADGRARSEFYTAQM